MVKPQTGLPSSQEFRRSILGPLLFVSCINDIVINIGCSIRLFADDTSLYIVVECPNTAARLLNADLETIFKWANDWTIGSLRSTLTKLYDYLEKTISCVTSSSFYERYNAQRNRHAYTSRTPFHQHLWLVKACSKHLWKSTANPTEST